jgi:hypothetical protein
LIGLINDRQQGTSLSVEMVRRIYENTITSN